MAPQSGWLGVNMTTATQLQFPTTLGVMCCHDANISTKQSLASVRRKQLANELNELHAFGQLMEKQEENRSPGAKLQTIPDVQ